MIPSATKWIAANAKLASTRRSIAGRRRQRRGNLRRVWRLPRATATPKARRPVLIYPPRLCDGASLAQRARNQHFLTHSVIKWFCNHYLNGTSDIDMKARRGAKTLAACAGLCPDRGRDPCATRREYAAR